MLVPAPKTYGRLLAGLVAYLLFSPVADQFLGGAGSLAIDAALLLPLVLGVWNLKRGTRWFAPGIALIVLLAIVEILNMAIPEHGIQWATYLFAAILFATMALIALQDVLFGGPIDGNRLTGAVCVYLLMAMAWALVYASVDALTHEPLFSNVGGAGQPTDAAALLYYSLVTLTTLGYGDIAPLTPLARMLAAVESVFGQLYLTILVAALVGKLLTSSSNGER